MFASASHDPAVQRSWVGYLGGESLDEIRSGLTQLVSGIIPDDIMAGWFIPTRADPSQAPPGCHTAYAVGERAALSAALAGTSARRLGRVARARRTVRRGRHGARRLVAPGFKDLILERHVNTPLNQEQSNPSAVRGNMIGGSAVPEQYGHNRPLPGIVTGGAARSFIPGLYLSNSIHPYGATHLATGYIAACSL